MKNSVLVVRFGDNDFGSSLRELGEILLLNVGLEPITYMESKGDLDEILTSLFRSCLCLHQHRFDMYEDYGSKEETLKEISEYQTRDYFKIKGAELVEAGDCSWDNGETLVVDFKTQRCQMV